MSFFFTLLHSTTLAFRGRRSRPVFVLLVEIAYNLEGFVLIKEDQSQDSEEGEGKEGAERNLDMIFGGRSSDGDSDDADGRVGSEYD